MSVPSPACAFHGPYTQRCPAEFSISMAGSVPSLVPPAALRFPEIQELQNTLQMNPSSSSVVKVSTSSLWVRKLSAELGSVQKSEQPFCLAQEWEHQTQLRIVCPSLSPEPD